MRNDRHLEHPMKVQPGLNQNSVGSVANKLTRLKVHTYTAVLKWASTTFDSQHLYSARGTLYLRYSKLSIQCCAGGTCQLGVASGHWTLAEDWSSAFGPFSLTFLYFGNPSALEKVSASPCWVLLIKISIPAACLSTDRVISHHPNGALLSLWWWWFSPSSLSKCCEIHSQIHIVQSNCCSWIWTAVNYVFNLFWSYHWAR